MRHVYECPMRWADLDLLGHVNNVVYVDYLQEARVDMLRTHGGATGADELAEGVVVVRHEVTYLAPLTFSFATVLIDTWITEIRAASFTMAYEVYQELPAEQGGRRVYLQASTVLTPYVFAIERPRRISSEERGTLEKYLEPAERTPRKRVAAVPATEAGHYPVHVRFSDVDVYGHVNNVKYFEYFQEARIVLLERLWGEVEDRTALTRIVVAQTDVDYRVPILFRQEPYECRSAITHVGARSVVIEAEIVDGDEVFSRARVVVVFFDPDTGTSTEPPAALRQPLLAAIAGPV